MRFDHLIVSRRVRDQRGLTFGGVADGVAAAGGDIPTCRCFCRHRLSKGGEKKWVEIPAAVDDLPWENDLIFS